MQKKQKKYEITHTECVMFLRSCYICKMVFNLERKGIEKIEKKKNKLSFI